MKTGDFAWPPQASFLPSSATCRSMGNSFSSGSREEGASRDDWPPLWCSWGRKSCRWDGEVRRISLEAIFVALRLLIPLLLCQALSRSCWRVESLFYCLWPGRYVDALVSVLYCSEESRRNPLTIRSGHLASYKG